MKIKRWTVQISDNTYHWEKFYTKSQAKKAETKIFLDKLQILQWTKVPEYKWPETLDKIKVVKL
jgi:hypothetical protein